MVTPLFPLVSHYHTVHIIDYRYFAKVKQQSLPDFVQGLDSQNVDVLFLNNISATPKQKPDENPEQSCGVIHKVEWDAARLCKWKSRCAFEKAQRLFFCICG